MKNKFMDLTKKLIGNKLWRSNVTITQLEKSKVNGNTNYIAGISKECKCVSKDIVNDSSFPEISRGLIIYVSALDLKEFNLDKNLIRVEFNGKSYEIDSIALKGILNNENCLVEFTVKI